MDHNGFCFLFGRRGILFTNGVGQVEVFGAENPCNSSGLSKRTWAARQQCFVRIYYYVNRRILSEGKGDSLRCLSAVFTGNV